MYVKWCWRVMEDIVAVLLRASSSPLLFPYLTGRLDLLSRLPAGGSVLAACGLITANAASFLLKRSQWLLRLLNCFLLDQFSDAPFLHELPCGISCNPAELTCCSHVPDGSSQGASPRWWELLVGAGPQDQAVWASSDGEMGLWLRSTPSPNPWPYSVDLINDIWVLEMLSLTVEGNSIYNVTHLFLLVSYDCCYWGQTRLCWSKLGGELQWKANHLKLSIISSLSCQNCGFSSTLDCWHVPLPLIPLSCSILLCTFSFLCKRASGLFFSRV